MAQLLNGKYKKIIAVNTRMKIGHFMNMPVVGIVRNMTTADFKEVLPVYYESGLRVIEVTMNTPEAIEMIKYANKHFAGKLIIGAGTVRTKTELQNSIKSGARFIVTPVLDEKIISICLQKKTPIISGAFTPTEIHRAWSAGSTLVKIFPATSLGVQFIKDIKAPMNEIALMPTGGIDHKNIASFFHAGAAAAGVGSKLFDKAMIREKNWNGLISHFMTFTRAVKSIAALSSDLMANDGRKQR
jgi:2-dehydro-3-deoxyphosphogluconate aldolase/(4S)-4-hydroxy-2-oxoglutarate aldolase